MTELSKNYNPQTVEQKWYTHWKNAGYFTSVPDHKAPFTVVIPPPNVTGVLHMGHTLNETVQDILVRKARMSGFNACWVPGSDHASIATEAKVVEMLREKGIDKSKISREEFLQYAFEWREKYGTIIYNQIERLGCSVDWNRVTFTMDDHYYQAVMQVFVELYKKGMIYRGARMINWDPVAKTALSDEEVEYKEVDGKLYYVKYFLASPSEGNGGTHYSSDHILIATQRPETIMGDTAVCVNPNDDRFTALKGRKVIVPLVNREVPVIFDEYVDMEFGTGALKVTPAHDLNDYNLGLKHNLEVVNTINEDGTLNEAAQVCVGMDRFVARKEVVRLLKEQGLIEKEENYNTRLGFSQRTNSVVEPRISTQWFLAMRTLADKALNEVLQGRVRIHPEERFLNTYRHWLENVKDWCISRQLWWGQRIPAWYDDKGNVFVAETEAEASKLAGTSSLTQDPDVLDTWFSSWLWPIEVFYGITRPGNKDIEYYYPTSVLVTGQDIIFFWVARMIMAGMEFKGQRPFSDVYFTGMVRDKLGRKMSKSLGNSPDLLQMIDRSGADAVRFGIMISSPAGNDLLFDESSPEQGRNFNNKIWNALKLVRSWAARIDESTTANHPISQEFNVLSFEGGAMSADVHAQMAFHFPLLWFENRLNEARRDIDRLFQEFRLSEALKTIYSLIWDDFCSWYLEWIKPAADQKIDATVYAKTIEFFTELMQLLHPFMPFITEEVYHLLADRKDDLCVRQFSSIESVDEQVLEEGRLLQKVITALRDARVKNQIKSRDEINLHIQTANQALFEHIQPILAKQVNAKHIAFTSQPVSPAITVVVDRDKFFLQAENAINTGSQKEELMKELQYLQGFLASVEKKLGNEKFVRNARPEVVALEQKKKADAESKIKVIEESLESM